MPSFSYWFNGRLSRKEFWLGFVSILAATMVIGFGLIAVGFGETQTLTGSVQADGGAPQKFTEVRTVLSPLPSLLLSLLMSIPTLVLSVRRRRDRNASGIDVAVIMAISLLPPFLAIFGITDNLVINALGLFVFVGGLVIIVPLGFLRGTVGPNKYGPDPLAPSSPDTP